MTWNLYYFWKAHFKLKFPLMTVFLQENMAEAGMSTEEEFHPENPLNNEEGNLRDGDI